MAAIYVGDISTKEVRTYINGYLDDFGADYSNRTLALASIVFVDVVRLAMQRVQLRGGGGNACCSVRHSGCGNGSAF